VRQLREKYVEMRAMRIEDASGGGDPRGRMRALAARFPGALREIDELPFATIERRIEELDRVIEHSVAPPRWARALADYHGWMRAALALRRYAGRDRDRDRALAWIDARYRPEPDEPPPGALRAAVDAVLRPPHGRLNRWVFAMLAERHGASPSELEAEAFPSSRAARRSSAG
jgi:hypothetical protein